MALRREVSPDALRLLGVSFLALFFEMVLIRYANSTVQVIKYFNNFMILSAVLGMGLGSLLVRPGRDLFKYFPAIALVVVGLMTYLDSYGYSQSNSTQVIWVGTNESGQNNLPVSLVILSVFCANFSFFVPLGYKLGELLNRFENRLEGYAYDLLGSLFGVCGFAMLSYLGVPPEAWFLLGGTVAVLFLRGSGLWVRMGSLACLAAVIFFTTLPEPGQWSPYYKVTLRPYHQDTAQQRSPLGYQIMVDKMRIQDALHFSPELERSFLAQWIPYYQLPYQFRLPGRTLILGGGSGNDATMALANGAEEVTVVEIDPVILRQGLVTHPHRPYRNQRVRTINDDGRSFLRRTQEQYDLILMNALDSHLQLPGLSTLRLESYMYTVEAFRDVKRLMNPQSIFMVHLSSTRKWMGERLYWSLTEAFGKEPVLLRTEGSPWGSIAFAMGPEGMFDATRTNFKVPVTRIDPDFMRKVKISTVLATDDWPHLYLSHPTLPTTYIVILIVILVSTFAAFRWAAPGGNMTHHLHFFFLGAGFMLLETRSITKSAVLFGSTWIVNAVMIGSILAVVFIANLLVWQWWRTIPTRRVYAGLFAGLILGYFVSIDFILNFGWLWRMLFVGLWLSIPIFFASVLFSRSFHQVQKPHGAFGANLLGIAVGGVLEYSSLILGLQVLYLVALAIYVLAWACAPHSESTMAAA